MKVFICAHPLYRYLDSIAEGFEANGCEVMVFEHRNTNVTKLASGNFLKRFKNRRIIHKINQDIIQAVGEFLPDLFLAINGEVLFDSTISWINGKCRSALWLVDGVENIKLPRASMNLFHHRFIFEPTDAALFEEATYLPYGCDQTVYFEKKVDKIYDVSFVGAGHYDRLEGLNQVAQFCLDQGYTFAVFGPFNVFKDKAMVEKYPFLHKAIKINDRLSPEQVNTLYNQTKVNINIHHSQSKEGVNPRVFEIFGSKNIQVVEDKAYLRQLFPTLPAALSYNDIPMLLENIQEILSHFLDYRKEMERIYQAVKLNHSFYNRAHKIIEVYNGEN